MAIQVRRGNYADLDKSKLVAGEPFTTLDQLPDGGYYIGMTIAPNQTVRLASYDDLTDVKTDCEQCRDDAAASAEAAALSETGAGDSAKDAEAWAIGERNGVPVTSGDDTYENNSKYYAGLAEDAWDNVHDAVEFITPVVSINFVTGQLEITGTELVFSINQTDGQLEWAVSV